MAEERNFYEETGFTMPEGVGAIPAEGGFDYYKHPSGTYRAIFGKMKALYKDPTGKSCEQTDIGASADPISCQIHQMNYRPSRIYIRRLYLSYSNIKSMLPLLFSLQRALNYTNLGNHT